MKTVFFHHPVVLISVDTLRSDHLPVYGYRGVDTPHIDELRRDSVLFSRAYSHSPLTLPSHLTIFTGVLPGDHGVRNNIGFNFDPSGRVTLPSLLAGAGYTTGAAVSAFVLRSGTGMGPMFDHYDDDFLLRGDRDGETLERGGAETAEAAASWIRAHAARPFFFFLHLYEPHSPYDPPEPFRSRYPLRYDGEIATADAVVGHFLDFLREAGLYDRSIVVFLSDHGEGLGDHGEPEHGVFLYREALQVPLMVKLPDGIDGSTIVDEPAQLIDLLPTIASLVGVEPPPGLAGVPLLEPPPGDPVRRPIVAETWVPRIEFGWSELWSLIEGTDHYIAAPQPELYDLAGDPGERHDLSTVKAADASRLAAALKPFVRGLEETPVIDPVEAERLRALGYVGVPAAQTGGPAPDPKSRITSLQQMIDAKNLAAGGETDKAIAQLHQVLAVNPGFTAGWLQLARICHESGRFDEAISAYRKTIGMAPSLTASCGAALGAIYLHLRQLDEAETWAYRCIDVGASSGHLLLARVGVARGDLVVAESETELAMRDPLYRVVGGVLLAEVLAAGGRADEALEAVDAAAQELEARHLDPVPRLHFVRGDVLARLNRFAEAEVELLDEISWFPDNLAAYTSLAVVYRVTRRPADARATLEHMVTANPGRASLVLAERTLREIGDAEGAAEWRTRIDALPRRDR